MQDKRRAFSDYHIKRMEAENRRELGTNSKTGSKRKRPEKRGALVVSEDDDEDEDEELAPTPKNAKKIANKKNARERKAALKNKAVPKKRAPAAFVDNQDVPPSRGSGRRYDSSVTPEYPDQLMDLDL